MTQKTDGIDIKETLLNLADKLIKSHGFKPGNSGGKSTDPLLKFLLWLDEAEEAREELQKSGIYYKRTAPLTKRKFVYIEK